MTRSVRTYDHRLRELVRQTGDVTIATSAGVPRSTAAGWLRRPARSTVTLDPLSMDQQDLHAEVLRLQRHVEKLRAIARILVAAVRVLDIDLGHHRIPDGVSKFVLVRAIERARGVLKLRKTLAMIGLSSSRESAVVKAEEYDSLPRCNACNLLLDDRGLPMGAIRNGNSWPPRIVVLYPRMGVPPTLPIPEFMPKHHNEHAVE